MDWEKFFTDITDFVVDKEGGDLEEAVKAAREAIRELEGKIVSMDEALGVSRQETADALESYEKLKARYVERFMGDEEAAVSEEDSDAPNDELEAEEVTYEDIFEDDEEEK